MREWKEIEIGNGLNKIIDYRGKTPPKSSNGILLISAANIKNGNLDFSTTSYISENDYQWWTTRGFTKSGDVLITTEAPAGEVALFPKDGKYLISRRVIALRTDEKLLHNLFLFYALQTYHVKRKLYTANRGSTVPRVLKTDITGLKIMTPDYKEQVETASILSSLDDKISLLRRQNETLERIAQTIFRRWFVDFEFPNEKGEPYRSSGGKMVESELGEVPEGWEVMDLASITLFLNRGITPKYCEVDGVPVINQKCIRSKSINFSLTRRHDNTVRKADAKIVKLGDVLVNSTGVGTLGRTAIVKRLTEKTVVADSHVTIVRPDTDKVLHSYLGLDLTGREREIEFLGEGSTGQTELSRHNLGKMLVSVPEMSIQRQFDSIAKSILDKSAKK